MRNGFLLETRRRLGGAEAHDRLLNKLRAANPGLFDRTFRSVWVQFFMLRAMLHWIKILCLLALTLLIMRLASWIPLVLCRRFLRLNGWKMAMLSNGLGLAAFMVFLRTQAVPGELIDPAAALFGLCVYTAFLLLDAYMSRLKATGSKQ